MSNEVMIENIVIPSSMVLLGIETANSRIIEQKRSVDGIPYINIYSNDGGRIFTLGSSQINKLQGIWFQKTLDELRELQKLGTPLTLYYYGDTFIILISDFSKIEPLFQNELRGPCKRYVGTIELIEV